uniref:hypothetical protein n=1 Tax=Prevotella sp. TaxID=59823 RepID=UPI00402803F6
YRLAATGSLPADGAGTRLGEIDSHPADGAGNRLDEAGSHPADEAGRHLTPRQSLPDGSRRRQACSSTRDWRHTVDADQWRGCADAACALCLD